MQSTDAAQLRDPQRCRALAEQESADEKQRAVTSAAPQKDRLLEHDLHPARPSTTSHTISPGDELAGLTPTLFEHVNPLGTYTFDTDRPAGQLRPLRAASAA
jgi:hypothetical protein